jgi:glycosyltransferase involved in cell wall biosynthesis
LASGLPDPSSTGFIGFLPDPLAAYRSLDVVVHASSQPEPFGLTIAEAMSCGRATIVSQAGGAAELFADGVDALGVPPRDDEALAAAILRLTADAGARQRLGEAARRRAVEHFDQARLGPQVLAAYRRFMAAPTLDGEADGGEP